MFEGAKRLTMQRIHTLCREHLALGYLLCERERLQTRHALIAQGVALLDIAHDLSR